MRGLDTISELERHWRLVSASILTIGTGIALAAVEVALVVVFKVL